MTQIPSSVLLAPTVLMSESLNAGSVRPLHPEPHEGKLLDIVIGIDVGTTFSGASYAILRPGETPDIISVSRWGPQHYNETRVIDSLSGPDILTYRISEYLL